MRKPIGALETALMKKPNMLPGRSAEPPMQPDRPFTAEPDMAAQGGNGQADFNEVVEELQQLVLEGKLPADFDLREACMDQTFADLIAEFPAEAALRIYYAENKAAGAEQAAMQRVNQQVKSRNALPRSARGGAMSAPAPNYRDMDDATFRKLLAEVKRSARNGNAPRL